MHSRNDDGHPKACLSPVRDHRVAIIAQSVIYGILPTIFDRMKGHTAPTSIALIVSPLASLMVDQKARFSSICKRAAFVTDDWLQY